MSRGDRSPLPASWQFTQLQRDLARMTKAQRRRLRVAVGRLGNDAAAEARSSAGRWSTRIPAAIRTRALVDDGRSRVGVELRVSKSVPHARAYEGISQQGSAGHFRHPVYGNRGAWVSQPTRPYLWPAVRARQDSLRRAVEQTVEDAARECGFR